LNLVKLICVRTPQEKYPQKHVQLLDQNRQNTCRSNSKNRQIKDDKSRNDQIMEYFKYRHFFKNLEFFI